MAELKRRICPTCGAELVLIKANLYECSYCGNQYNIENNNKNKWYQFLITANAHRESLDFAQAQRIYNAILKDCDERIKADVYWNLFLCEQKTVFETNQNGERFPSFCDISPVEIKHSEYYNKALEYAQRYDSTKFLNFSTLADEMEEVKKKYSTIKQHTNPYDVFICFKHTDDKGKDTSDYNIGYDIYKCLKENYNVFFSAITLKNTTIREFEPNIYYALYTAKVMLILCSKKEFIESQWLHNEWFRFKTMSKTSAQPKAIIPIFIDGFTPENLPDDLRSYQGIKADISLIANLNKSITSILKPQNRDEELKKNIFDELDKKYLAQRNNIVDSSNDVLKRKADDFFSKGQYDSAKSLYEECLKTQGNNYLLKYLIAECDVAKSTTPDSVSSFINATKAYIKSLCGDYGTTSSMFKEALDKANKYQFKLLQPIYEKMSNDSDFISPNKIDTNDKYSFINRVSSKYYKFADDVWAQGEHVIELIDSLVADMFKVPGIKALVETQIKVLLQIKQYLTDTYTVTIRQTDGSFEVVKEYEENYTVDRYKSSIRETIENYENGVLKYIEAKLLLNDQKYVQACMLLADVRIYDSGQLIVNADRDSGGAIYEKAVELFENNDYDHAQMLFSLFVGSYPEAQSYLNKIDLFFEEKYYAQAVEFFDDENYDEALKLFEQCGKYKNVERYIKRIKKQYVKKKIKSKLQIIISILLGVLGGVFIFCASNLSYDNKSGKIVFVVLSIISWITGFIFLIISRVNKDK